MKLNPERLASHFKSHGPKPIYWVSGDEVLLRNECLDLLRHQARELGFDEREKYTIEAQFDWSELMSTLYTPSLFAEKKRIEIDLTFSTIKKQVTDPLLEVIDAAEKMSQHLTNLIIIYSNKIDAKQLQSKWYKRFTTVGVHVPIWPIPKEQLPGWIAQRMHQAGLQADQNACQALAHQVEGNLLAAQQEIEKLALLSSNPQDNNAAAISAEDINQTSSDRAQFSVFDFSDALLTTNTNQVLRCLDRLKESGAESVLVLWALGREIRLLIEGHEALQQKKNLNQWMKSKRIHPKRQPLVVQALKRTNYPALLDSLVLCQHTDASIKGLSALDPWFYLSLIASAVSSGHFDSLTQTVRAKALASAY